MSDFEPRTTREDWKMRALVVLAAVAVVLDGWWFVEDCRMHGEYRARHAEPAP